MRNVAFILQTNCNGNQATVVAEHSEEAEEAEEGKDALGLVCINSGGIQMFSFLWSKVHFPSRTFAVWLNKDVQLEHWTPEAPLDIPGCFLSFFLFGARLI